MTWHNTHHTTLSLYIPYLSDSDRNSIASSFCFLTLFMSKRSCFFLTQTSVSGEITILLYEIEACCHAFNSVACTAVRRQGNLLAMATLSNSTNIFWQDCQVGRLERQKLLNQKGCVVWITGLSGSGKSTLACSLSRELHSKGKLSYVLDGDNLRHGLNKDLGFKAEDRAENIRRTGEVAKLFADAGLICVASLISPYRRDRDTCRAMFS
ncbi:Adenylyl-sulfate kinase 3 [Glycine max]|nr:Adenylyl-sulfate kinase 3 [Glycine max]